jgi:hypothetical protein
MYFPDASMATELQDPGVFRSSQTVASPDDDVKMSADAACTATAVTVSAAEKEQQMKCQQQGQQHE